MVSLMLVQIWIVMLVIVLMSVWMIVAVLMIVGVWVLRVIMHPMLMEAVAAGMLMGMRRGMRRCRASAELNAARTDLQIESAAAATIIAAGRRPPLSIPTNPLRLGPGRANTDGGPDTQHPRARN